MITCKRCNSSSIIKNGIVRSKQRYNCKDCGCNFVNGDRRKGKHLDKKRLSLHLYLEGSGFRSIGRLLGVSNVSVLRWIRQAGIEIQQYHKKRPKPDKVRVMEFDEMWHFIKKKKENYGFGLHWTEQGSLFLILSPEVEPQKQEKNFGKR